MRILSFFLLIHVTGSLTAQVNSSFVKLRADSVVMYDFAGGKGGDLYIVDDNGILAKDIFKSVTLDNTLSEQLKYRLGSKKSYGKSSAACFDPHLGFVFYNSGVVVAHVTVCLDCNRLHSSIEIQAQKQGVPISGNENYYTGQGMSRSFRVFLNSLLKTHKFSHQIPADRLSF